MDGKRPWKLEGRDHSTVPATFVGLSEEAGIWPSSSLFSPYAPHRLLPQQKYLVSFLLAAEHYIRVPVLSMRTAHKSLLVNPYRQMMSQQFLPRTPSPESRGWFQLPPSQSIFLPAWMLNRHAAIFASSLDTNSPVSRTRDVPAHRHNTPPQWKTPIV